MARVGYGANGKIAWVARWLEYIVIGEHEQGKYLSNIESINERGGTLKE